jgi:hypothetical protein
MQGDRDETRGLALQASRRQVDGPTSAEGRAKIAAAACARHARGAAIADVPPFSSSSRIKLKKCSP